MPIPIVYREGTGNLNFSVDYFDYAAGAGYKKYYFAGLGTSSGASYALISDGNLISDSSYFNLQGNATSANFDLTFNNPATISGEAIVNYRVDLSGSNSDTFTPTFTFSRLRNGVSTAMGTIVPAAATDGDPSVTRVKAAKGTLIKTDFSIGDTLRVNITLSTNAVAATMPIDPSGHVTVTDDRGGTATSSASVNLPFILNI